MTIHDDLGLRPHPAVNLLGALYAALRARGDAAEYPVRRDDENTIVVERAMVIIFRPEGAVEVGIPDPLGGSKVTTVTITNYTYLLLLNIVTSILAGLRAAKNLRDGGNPATGADPRA